MKMMHLLAHVLHAFSKTTLEAYHAYTLQRNVRAIKFRGANSEVLSSVTVALLSRTPALVRPVHSNRRMVFDLFSTRFHCVNGLSEPSVDYAGKSRSLSKP